MNGQKVITTQGDEGTVAGWNHEKTEVLLKLKGKPRFSTPWYRRYEIKSIVMEKVKMEDLDLHEVDFNRIELHNVKVGKKKSECDISIDGKQLGDHHVFNEELKSDVMKEMIIQNLVEKRDLILAKKSEMDERLEEVKQKRKEQEQDEKRIQPISLEDEKDKALNELTAKAQPMKSEGAEGRILRKGLVRGTIVKRTNAWNEDKGYGILTGDFEEVDGSALLKMTDGSTFMENFCEPIQDVNKYVLRTVQAECGRVMEDAHKFVDLIQQRLADVIEN